MYFNGEKACFDWEEISGDWLMKLPSGVIVADICQADVSSPGTWSLWFYPTGSVLMKDSLEELKLTGTNYASKYGFKILDNKLKVML